MGVSARSVESARSAPAGAVVRPAHQRLLYVQNSRKPRWWRPDDRRRSLDTPRPPARKSHKRPDGRPVRSQTAAATILGFFNSEPPAAPHMCKGPPRRLAVIALTEMCLACWLAFASAWCIRIAICLVALEQGSTC